MPSVSAAAQGAIVGRDVRIVVVERLCRQSVDLVAGAIRGPFDDFTHLRPGVLGAFSRVDSARPRRAGACDNGANTRGNRAGFIRPAREHQTVLAPQQRLHGPQS